MTLKQLRYLREIAQQGLHLSHAAVALHTSQSGVSRQIKLLEQELGIVIFKRKRNHIQTITQEGREVLRLAERTLWEAENLGLLGEELKNETKGNLVIAATHTHARYTLPSVITQFSESYPSVRLVFRQGNREDVFRWVETGDADIVVGTDCDAKLNQILLLPFGQFHRIVITLPRHPLLKIKRLTLEDIARYPLITYGFRKNGHWKFNYAFEAKGLHPNIPFSAGDSDVSKAYVELGHGIAILPHITFNLPRDGHLRAIDARHLFPPETMHVGINRARFHRGYLFRFLEMLSPKLARRRVERALETSL